MSLLDRFRGREPEVLSILPPPQGDWRGVRAPNTNTSIAVNTSGTGGRQSIDSDATQFFSSIAGSLSIFAPFSSDDYWRNTKLDARTLDRVSPSKLIELLADVSPDVSKALWDFLLFMNPGYDLKVLKPGTETPNKQGEQALDLFFNNLHGPYALNHRLPLDVILSSLFMGGFLRGAFVAELVLDDSGTLPIDIATPDPVTIRARARQDPLRKMVWEIGQFQMGQFIVLDRPTVFYVPLHPLPGHPYGRSLAAPAVFATLFMVGLLHDLRRVIAQQGYPRLDIMVDYDKLKPPQDVMNNAGKLKAWCNEVVAEVQAYYATLKPEDAFVHSGAVTLGRPVGTLGNDSLGKLDTLISEVERMAIRALKSMPLLFGVNESTTETHANRQWEVHVAGIKILQHLAEFIMESICTIALQVQGIAADVQFRFAELRAAELLRDAQVEQVRTATLANWVRYGWIDNDEAAQEMVGHDAVGDMPIAVPTSSTAPKPPDNADPGSERKRFPFLPSDDRLNGNGKWTDHVEAPAS